MGFILTDGKPYWVSYSASRVDVVSKSYTLHFTEGLQCTWQNRRKNTFHVAALRKNFRLSRHLKELSLVHRDAEISSYKRKTLLRVLCRVFPMLSNIFIIIWLEGPLDYYLEDFWCVVTTFQRDLQNGITLVSLYEELKFS